MGESVVTLILSGEEREFVFELLEERQRTLLREISRADHHDFKVALQNKERLLESVLSRLGVQA